MKQTPRERMFNKKYIANFNPADPSEDLLSYLEGIITTKGNFNGNYKSKSVSELPLDQLEYLAYTCKSSSAVMKQATKLQLFIRLYEDLDILNTDDMTLFIDTFKEDFPDTDISFLQASIDLEGDMPTATTNVLSASIDTVDDSISTRVDMVEESAVIKESESVYKRSFPKNEKLSSDKPKKVVICRHCGAEKSSPFSKCINCSK